MRDLLGVIGQLLPVGLAAALSTVPISLTLVILLSKRRKITAVPFAAGYVAGNLAVVMVATLAAQQLRDPVRRQPLEAGAVLEMVLGLALVVLGVLRIRHRGDVKSGSRLGALATSMTATMGGVRACALGMLLGFRAKSILLAGVVGLQLHSLRSDTWVLLVLLGYVLIATSTVVVPVLLTVIAPRWMAPKLTAGAELLTAKGTVIGAIVLVMVGVVVVGSGIGDLA